MTCIKTGAVVLMECHDLVFHADLFLVANAIVVRANGPLVRDLNAFSYAKYKDKFCDHHQLTHRLIGSRAGADEFWREDLGIFVVPRSRLPVEAPPSSSKCDTCDGSGLRTISGGGSGDPEWDADDQPCPECNPDYSRVKP